MTCPTPLLLVAMVFATVGLSIFVLLLFTVPVSDCFGVVYRINCVVDLLLGIEIRRVA